MTSTDERFWSKVNKNGPVLDLTQLRQSRDHCLTRSAVFCAAGITAAPVYARVFCLVCMFVWLFIGWRYEKLIDKAERETAKSK